MIAVTGAVLLPVTRNDFAGYDDDEYITRNPRVNTGLTRENARWAFTAVHSSNWHPVTWMSHQLDATLFGLNPARHHAVNLIFHLANTALLFLWLNGLTGALWRSAFVALLFGLHPLHVESVAWIAERKDVLSGFFGLLTLGAYTAYARKPAPVRYAAVCILFALGLLAKPMLVTLPLVLLLLDWWPLGRGPRILEKLPLFALSALSAAATLWAQDRSGAVAGIGGLPLPLRLSNAAVSYIKYLWKTIWPIDLAVFYPFPLGGIPARIAIASVAALVAVTALVFVLRKRSPWLAVGWAWYLVTLLPVIGIVQVGMQAMADRYMYLPMIGLLIAAAWTLAALDARVATATGVLAAAACGILTARQIPVWKDGLTLFTHTIAVTRDNFVAHDNLGVELDRRGRYDEAIAHYRETLRIRPGDRNGESNLAQATFDKGERLYNQKKPDEAFASFQEGMRYRPPTAAVQMYIGLILLDRGEFDLAASQLRIATQMDPSRVRAHVGLGVAFANLRKDNEARQSFEQAVRLDPTNVEARFDLGLVLAALGQRANALRQFDEILRLKPDYAPAIEARRAMSGK